MQGSFKNLSALSRKKNHSWTNTDYLNSVLEWPIRRWEVCDKSKSGENRDSSSHKVFVKERYDTLGNPWGHGTNTCWELPSYVIVKKWVAEFKWDRDNADDSRSGNPKTSTTDEQVNAIHRMVLDDRRLPIQLIADAMRISSVSIHTVWTEILGMNKISSKNADAEEQAERGWDFQDTFDLLLG